MANDTKKMFRDKGTCSQTFLHLLNREFGHINEFEEIAADAFYGGLLRTGNQCGMLWGASLAVGAEAYRKYRNTDKGIAIAIRATQHLIDAFSERTSTPVCRDVIKGDLSSKMGRVKLIGKNILAGHIYSQCFNLAEKWAPEAVRAAKEGLSFCNLPDPISSTSCASVLAQKIGANDKEIIVVAGFAGGLGLSGNACGALGAALWLKVLNWHRKNPGKFLKYPKNHLTEEILKTFKKTTGSEMQCRKISRRKFSNLEEHAEYIKTGGCDMLITALSGGE